MLQILYKRNAILSINHIWFYSAGTDTPSFAPASFCYLHGLTEEDCRGIPHVVRDSLQSTLMTDLTLPEEELWKKTSKTYRNEIRRCQKEEQQVAFYTSADLLQSPQVTEAFQTCYEQMYRTKGRSDKFNIHLFRRYAQAGCLLVSCAYKDQLPAVFHAYILDQTQCRLWYSCSGFRDDKQGAEEIGRLNKFLHWRDMQELKARGLQRYDWGGVDFTQPSLKGISQFKKRFGGDDLTYHNLITSPNPLYRTLFRLMRRD